jgi:ACS family tartrate transporter-like MFS transporter
MPASAAPPDALHPRVDVDDSALAAAALRRASAHLLPFLFVLYVFNFLDRTNVGIAALQMNRDLGFSASAYGLGAGIFFIGYALFEVPSNLILARVGARRWIARIMVSWGLIATAMMLVRTPMQFYVLRFLLGVAEAGFFPGIVYYLSEWFPTPQRARVLSRFMIAIPLSSAIGNPLGALLLRLDGRSDLSGWQWLFLLEGIPSVLLGVAVWRYLPDRPEAARWLAPDERAWLVARRDRERTGSPGTAGVPALAALAHPAIWLSALLYFLMMTTNYSYTFWAPILIRDALNATATAVGVITGGIACVAAGVMLVVSARSDRTGERFGHAAACALVSALGCLGAALLPSPVGRVIALAAVFVGVAGFFAPFWCIPTALLQGTAAAAGIALVNSIGNLGGFAGPYVVGLLQDATGGTRGAFMGLAGLAASGAALCMALRRSVARASPRGRSAPVARL